MSLVLAHWPSLTGGFKPSDPEPMANGYAKKKPLYVRFSQW